MQNLTASLEDYLEIIFNHTCSSNKVRAVDIANNLNISRASVTEALKKHLGARGLILTINTMFQEIFYEVANNPGKYQQVIVGHDIVSNNHDFTLIEKPQKVKKRMKTING